MQSQIADVLRDTNKLSRYLLSGFVGLAVAWAIDSKHTVLKDMHSVAGSWWPVLLLAPTLGFLIYSLHLVVYWPSYGFAARWFALLLRNRSSGYRDVWRSIDATDTLRWKRRLSKENGELAIQQSRDSWSAKIHFLYCSSWALVGAPLVMKWMSREVSTAVPLTAGVVLFLLALVDDLRLELRIVDTDDPGPAPPSAPCPE